MQIIITFVNINLIHNIMRNKWVFLLIIFSLLFTSCNKESETYTPENENIENSYLISESEGKILVERLHSFTGFTKSNSDLLIESDNAEEWLVTANVKHSEKGSLKLEKIPLYKYKLKAKDKNGYAVVVGDSRFQSPLIYVEEGSLNDTIDIVPLKLYVRSIPALVEEKIVQYYDSTSLSNKTLTKSDNQTLYSRSMLCTSWSQASPYNASCPASTCFPDRFDGRYPAGCVPIAMTQIMAHHGKPTSMDWNAIRLIYANTPLSSSAVRSLNSLLSTIRERLGASYSCTGTGASSSVVPYLFPSYGYSCSSLQSYSFSAVKYSLGNGWPVYMRGNSNSGGHAWVCDGWTNYGVTSGDNNYFHMNWGWNSSNGWFYVSTTEAPTFLSYRNLEIITNIH